MDWRTVEKIDAHIHILPDAVIAANQGVDDPYILAGGIDECVRLMDKHHITKAIIMPFNDPFLMSMEFTISAVHQNLMDFGKRYPGRFLLFADVDVRNTIEETLAQFDSVMASGAFVGMKIHPTNTGMPLDCPYFDAIYSYAEENHIPVEIHSYPRNHSAENVCSPSRLQRVLSKHPSLRVSVAHLGGVQFAELFCVPVWANLSGVLPDLVSHMGVGEANKVLRRFGSDRLIFATDYPQASGVAMEHIYETYFDSLNQMDFTDDEIENIAHRNIERFLGLK